MNLTKKLGQYATVGLLAMTTGCSTMSNYNTSPEEMKATRIYNLAKEYSANGLIDLDERGTLLQMIDDAKLPEVYDGKDMVSKVNALRNILKKKQERSMCEIGLENIEFE